MLDQNCSQKKGTPMRKGCFSYVSVPFNNAAKVTSLPHHIRLNVILAGTIQDES